MLTSNMHLHMGYSRIVLLAREGVQLKIMNDCMDKDIPAIWVKVTSRGRKPLVIGGVYREFHHLLQKQPNNTDDWELQLDRWKRTVDSWRKASKDAKCVLIGDLNINYLNWDLPNYRLKKLVQKVKDEIETLGFAQLIKTITRAWPGQPSSLVDHLWTNAPDSVMSTNNAVRASSDHNVISAILRTKDRREHVHDTRRRNMKNFNLSRYRGKIENIDWKDLYESKNINIVNDIFVHKVGTILDEEAPLKNFQFRKNYINWLSPELKLQMELRDRIREQARTSGDRAQWLEYKRERNKCSKNLHKVKIEHFKNLFENLSKENDTRNIYGITRKLLHWKAGSGPQKFLIQGKLIERPIDLANTQIKYFSDKVNKLINNLPASTTNPLMWLEKAMLRWESHGKFPKFTFRELTLSETIQLVSGLGNSTSAGIDYIDALAIKSAIVSLASPLRHLINTSLSTSTYANRWKISKILPLLKSPEMNKMLPSSFRPIAILPTVSKLVEKAAQSQMLEYMTVNNMLNDSSHAYRKGYSTTMAMLEISEELFKAAEEKKISAIMTLDQSAAFDCVHHDILTEKTTLLQHG